MVRLLKRHLSHSRLVPSHLGLESLYRKQTVFNGLKKEKLKFSWDGDTQRGDIFIILCHWNYEAVETEKIEKMKKREAVHLKTR